MDSADINKITSLCKRRGFVFPSSEIYGGWEATYDFGPLGAEILRNLRNLWWEEFVHNQPDIVGIDGAIISHPRVWEASGHVESFADAMVEDQVTHKRFRADHIIDEALNISSDGSTLEEFDRLIEENKIKSPDGNKLSKARRFNSLVEVEVGTLESEKTNAYLRGETCQPIFYNFELVRSSMRKKLPFGIAQIGKAFRNEIKVGPYFHRTREFEQMELEMFIHPKDAEKYFNRFKKWSIEWLKSLGLNDKKLRLRDQEFKERAHYNKIATDIEYEYPFGWKEFQGIHYRGDWDLKRHGQFSGFDFTYKDEETGESYIPHVVEYSIGLNRLMLVLLFDAYYEDGERVVLKLDPKVAPYRAAVFPLVRNKENLLKKAEEVFGMLLEDGLSIDYDDRGNIGKRYMAQDEIGTPSCITIDYQTLEDETVTVRDRDTTEQIRVKIDDLGNALRLARSLV
ncbi:glycine--tRNA ligase [candidate division WWE3 bacterium RIFCSPHIGHO2_12_FULL_38_15]|uniref:glycine--tRNA ligase n=1 Tax=candidate division WWE3 bacterium RIFCSPHIGHO2_02_FULL_38_14 TaxID=1802620 RepID=A0A1F4V9Z1_UNCKA|nr:MAG: glycine--tRNA ligase [candidate division WWE3 bacterium RIFCSPHIGHO2_01_FULL_38_45]OGC49154.1 MAG: glycine--tRNA ligase [candidate division WWE3 bacterium RIFCSPHIGHO2_12_FULL_38_15]OGC52580.1 MAG: glycine--tRNA ligase [candidate division WWE3 bacterium RIFCSPLOWO2_01_FULL_37_24]OGC54071.1 MAG: glycine--tRNA ligase [candidate division WWE3 bacterium RIFCSPHIGHO2_02_FULL_38_14]HLB51757.1 glycine--tRNA ligase [Patescibacteria group bacterium]